MLTSIFEGVIACRDDGRFRDNCRVSCLTFDSITDRLSKFAEQNDVRVPSEKAFVDMPMRVAMTLSYHPQESGIPVWCCEVHCNRQCQ